MARRKQLPEGVIEGEYVIGHRKGVCPECNIWGEMKPAFPVYVDPSSPMHRRPDGSLYTLEEMQLAVEDYAERWNKGRFRHHRCALDRLDILDGFDIASGDYQEPPKPLQLAAAE